MKIKDRYKLNKISKVGDSCICPSCGKEFTKEHYQQAFARVKEALSVKISIGILLLQRNAVTRAE